jgi:membrane-associated phospholipid phosphatase
MQRLSRIDRRLGDAVRRTVAAVPHGPPAASAIAAIMSPGFRVAVAVLIARRGRRGTGIRALGSGVAAAVAARLLRDRLGRSRPGARREGGFPSRHAAAAAAIAATVGRGDPGLGRILGAAAVLGGLARIADAEHEPADIAAGTALGLAIASALAGRSRPRCNPRREGQSAP